MRCGTGGPALVGTLVATLERAPMAGHVTTASAVMRFRVRV